jgi:hypothetical protein
VTRKSLSPGVGPDNEVPDTHLRQPRQRLASPIAGCASCGGRQNRGVQFSADLRDRVADGTITVSYRLWSRPKVKVGGVYRSGSVAIEIDDIELLPFSSITDEDLARTGENDVEALRRRAAHAGPIGHDTLLYRVEFHVARQPDDDDR